MLTLSCVLAVGQAVWNCGTLEMECIKNTLELGSECFGCVCEIFDVWWPDDAPNCFKKELKKIVGRGADVSGNATVHILPNITASAQASGDDENSNNNSNVEVEKKDEL